jgi:hypothetical protein
MPAHSAFAKKNRISWTWERMNVPPQATEGCSTSELVMIFRREVMEW